MTLRQHFMYGAWSGMVNRCHNPNNSSYQRYGALGIAVCERWRRGEGGKIGFACFLEDMGERPDGKTLDRIDPTCGYNPSNCRWATPSEQRRNISERGRKAASRKISQKAKARWAEWRETNDLRPELTRPQQQALLSLPVPLDQKPLVLRSYRSLVRKGLAVETKSQFVITDDGTRWIVEGRPQTRNLEFSPNHLRSLAVSLEI